MPEPIGASVEAMPSADNGNVPVDAPNPEPTPVTPSESKEPVTPTGPELFELPDGRKVDADTLSKEWKENFYPDYTRKSQELAKTKSPELQETKPTNANPLDDPNWQPQSYAELLRMAEENTLKAFEAKEQARVEARQAVEDQVASQLTELKKADPSLNENNLFLHANKYGFRDLKQAHQNMKDMSELAKTVQQTTAKNIAKRADPVSISPGATGMRSDPSQFETAREFLRSIKT